MSFKVEEIFIEGKKGLSSECEDRIVITDHFVSIIDGATSKSDLLFDGKTTGRMAGELIESVIKSSDTGISFDDFVEAVNNTFQDFYQSNNLLEQVLKNPVDRLNASMVIYNAGLGEIWLIGDCQAIVNGQWLENNKKIDTTLAELRSLILELAFNEGSSIEELLKNDVGREYIYPLLKKQSKFQNSDIESDFSYGVVDGFPIDPRGIKKVKVREPEISLGSDGYPRLFPTLEESERHLWDILETDPLCFRKFKSTKGLQQGLLSFDDRAYVRLKV